MDHKAFRWALSFIVTLQLATAHIGLRYMVYEHKEGSIPLRVYLKLPESAPGIVDISFKSFTDNIDRISVNSELKGSVELGENSSHNIAIPVNGEESTFSSKLPLFKYGAYSINVEVQQNGKIEQVIIPVNFFASENLELDSIGLSVLFVTVFIVSFLGIFFIRNAYSYNRKKEFEKILKSKNNSRFLQFAEIFIIIFMISYVSIKWWDERKTNYDQNNYFNLKNNAKTVNNGKYDILKINIVDKKWINEKMPNLIPDHGKIMHMYMISDDFRSLAHLHLTRSEDRSRHGTGGNAAKYFGIGTESDESTWDLPAEFSPTPHERGILSMARSQNPDSGGSQFFICVADARFLDNQYTVFGKVVSGMDAVDAIVSAPRDARDNPNDRIEMKVRLEDKK